MLICMIQMFYLKSRHWEIKVIDINHITRRMFGLDSFWAAPRSPKTEEGLQSSSALRLKKEPRDSDRDINNLLDKRSHASKTKVLERTHTVGDERQ